MNRPAPDPGPGPSRPQGSPGEGWGGEGGSAVRASAFASAVASEPNGGANGGNGGIWGDMGGWGWMGGKGEIAFLLPCPPLSGSPFARPILPPIRSHFGSRHSGSILFFALRCYGTASHSLGVALHSESGWLCRCVSCAKNKKIILRT